MEELLSKQSNVKRHMNLVKNISLTVLACVPFVGDVAYGIKEIRRDLNEYKKGKREVELDRFEEEYLETLKTISDEVPLFLVIDDIQWVDKQTLGALQRYMNASSLASRKIVLLLSGRFDEVQRKPEIHGLYEQSKKHSGFNEFELRPFTGDQVEEYYRMRFPNAFVDADLLLWLQQKTGGNPFFLVSYIKHLLVESILKEDGSLSGSLDAYKGLPAEIQHVTNWLMKALPEDELILLLSASVIGYEFSLHELEHLMQQPTLQLIRRLRKIKALFGICEPAGYRLINGKESSVFHFTQHAIHTALYNELTVEEKENMHRSIAQYLNNLRMHGDDDPDKLSSIASALSIHAHLGKQPDLEYESILLKARNTPELLDEATIMNRLEELSPEVGRSIEEVQERYRQALVQAPLVTRQSEGARIPVTVDDPEKKAASLPLTAFLLDMLALMGSGLYDSAQRQMEMRMSAIQKRELHVHPLVLILWVLNKIYAGKADEATLKKLEELAGTDSSGLYGAIGKIVKAQFMPDSQDADAVRLLRQAAAYKGKYSALLLHTISAVLEHRFADNEEYQELRAQYADVLGKSGNGLDAIAEAFPKTGAILETPAQ